MESNETPTLEEVYRLHRKRIKSICVRIVRNEEDAEDMTQEVFIHLMKNLHKFKGESRFTTWLHRLAVNLVLMNIRGKQTKWWRGVASLEELADNEEGQRVLNKAVACRDGRLEGVADREAVSTVLEGLPPGYLVALELDAQGFGPQEVADILEMSLGAAKRQLSHAKHAARMLLGAPEPAAVSVEQDTDDLLADFERYL